MTEPALAQVDEGRHRRTEDPVIGDQLAQEAGINEAALFWERGKLGPLYLAGTDIPGNVRFDLTPFDNGPWWDPELAVPHGPAYAWVPPFDVADAVAEIFGDLGLPPRHAEPPPLEQCNPFTDPDPTTEIRVTYDAATITAEEVKAILTGQQP